MRTTLAVLMALSLASVGVTLLAGPAEARCLYGSEPGCILQECMDCVPTLPRIDCILNPDGGNCRCAPECYPP